MLCQQKIACPIVQCHQSYSNNLSPSAELENSSILLLITVLLGNLKGVSIKVHQSFFIQACSSGIILINIIFRRQMKTICVFKLENHYHSSPSQCIYSHIYLILLQEIKLQANISFLNWEADPHNMCFS